MTLVSRNSALMRGVAAQPILHRKPATKAPQPAQHLDRVPRSQPPRAPGQPRFEARQKPRVDRDPVQLGDLQGRRRSGGQEGGSQRGPTEALTAPSSMHTLHGRNRATPASPRSATAATTRWSRSASP